jgi:S-(hydroxymethyl)glutathione dehydrogenase/alcohol dehydrogenase
VQAAVLRQTPGALTIERVEHDEPRQHEVLVRTGASGLCHSDLHHLVGTGYPGPLPRVLGHESAGVVERVGPLVEDVAPGDHVVTCPAAFCGRCEFCLSGRPTLCDGVGTSRGPGEPPRLTLDGQPCGQSANLGSFAESMLVHERALVKISPSMPLDRAALIGCAVLTGLGAVFRTARVDPGSTVAVVGCGGVGLNCVQGARLAGASRIVAIDVRRDKLELAARLGATDLVDAAAGDPVAQVRALFPGLVTPGVDYSFEALGTAPTIEQAFAMLRKGGVATIIGIMAPDATFTLRGADLVLERRIQGSVLGSNRFRQDVPRYVDLYLQGRLELDALVTARIALSDVNEGFAAMAAGAGARSVICFD